MRLTNYPFALAVQYHPERGGNQCMRRSLLISSPGSTAVVAMSTPQNIIAIVYDYDQTLSPSYMQDEVVFPAFGINSASFWRRCSRAGAR